MTLRTKTLIQGKKKKKKTFSRFLLKLAVNMLYLFIFLLLFYSQIGSERAAGTTSVSQLFDPRICTLDETQAKLMEGRKKKKMNEIKK